MTKAFPANGLKPAGQLAQSWEFELPHDRTLEEALEASAWAHAGMFLRPHDTIRLIPQIGRDYIVLLVLDAGRGFAKVKLLAHIPDETNAVEETEPQSDLLVKWISPSLKFGVIRRSDNVRLKDGMENRRDAQRWADDHIAALAH
jgi:hypothetical protein